MLRVQGNKTFYGHNLLMIMIIKVIVRGWPFEPAKSNVCGQGQEPTLEWNTWKELHSGMLPPFS